MKIVKLALEHMLFLSVVAVAVFICLSLVGVIAALPVTWKHGGF